MYEEMNQLNENWCLLVNEQLRMAIEKAIGFCGKGKFNYREMELFLFIYQMFSSACAKC